MTTGDEKRALLAHLATKPPADFPLLLPGRTMIVDVDELPDDDRAEIRSWATGEGCRERYFEPGSRASLSAGRLTRNVLDVRGVTYLLIPDGVLFPHIP
jgi:hypothetical protein